MWAVCSPSKRTIASLQDRLDALAPRPIMSLDHYRASVEVVPPGIKLDIIRTDLRNRRRAFLSDYKHYQRKVSGPCHFF